MSFFLPNLAFSYKALNPYIDCQTIKIHYSKYHAIYTNELNKAIKASNLKNFSIEKILMECIHIPSIRKNAGAYYNHSLYWSILTDKKRSCISEDFLFYIKENFNSFELFKAEFTNSALNNLSLGWTWLSVCQKTGKLFISSTYDQDNPIMPVVDRMGTPILGLDMGEHAFFLKFKYKFYQYIKSFWKIVNWGKVYKLFKNNILL